MVHLRCKHLHSKKVEQTASSLLWKALLITARPKPQQQQQSCQTRTVFNLATRSKKAFNNNKNFSTEIDQSIEQQLQHEQKLTSKRRIPVHVSSQVNKETTGSPVIFKIHSHLKEGQVEEAWKLLDKSATQITHIPRLTAHMLTTSIYKQAQLDSAKLTLNFGKLQTLYFKRLEILAGLVYKSNHKWDKSDFCTVIELYGQLNQIKRAESIFRNMKYYCSQDELLVEIYNSLLTVYVRQFKYMDEITKNRTLAKLKTLEIEMNRNGIQFNTTTYNMLIAAQVKSHNLQQAEILFNKMKETTPADTTTYNILLNGYLKDCRNNKDKEITNKWMEKLLSSGTKPSKKTFISIMDGLADQVIRQSRSKEYQYMLSTSNSISKLYKMMIKLGHLPDTETINTLLKGHVAANYSKQIDKVISMLDLSSSGIDGGCGNCSSSTASVATMKEKKIMKKIKIKPDTYTFNILIQHYLNTNKDTAFQMYDLMCRLNLEPDTVTYSNFIQHYANMGEVDECLKYFDVMQKKGIPTNYYIYNILLNCSVKYPQYKDLITPHLTAMSIQDNITLDTVSRNILLLNSNDKEVDEFINLIDIRQQPFNTRTFNTILQSAGKYYKNSLNATTLLLDGMIQSLDRSNLKPDIYTFALSLRNAAYQGDMMKAESIFKEMTDSGIQPNLFVFSHLIYGYSNIGKMDKAAEILRGMSITPYNIHPTAINYAPLIKGYAENAEFDKAYDLFREMLDNHINADLVIYTILARVFLDSGNGKKAIQLLESISKAGIENDAASLTLLMNAYATTGGAGGAGNKNATLKINSIYETLKENDWLDGKSITTLLSAHHRMKNPQGAWKLWNLLKQDQQQKELLSVYHYNALLTCLTTDAKAWFPIAKSVFQELKNQKDLSPDTFTYDLMIWGAYSVSDFKAIQELWDGMENKESTTLLVRSYFAIMTVLINIRQLDQAKKVYQEYYQKVSSNVITLPNSTTVWTYSIRKLARNQGF